MEERDNKVEELRGELRVLSTSWLPRYVMLGGIRANLDNGKGDVALCKDVVAMGSTALGFGASKVHEEVEGQGVGRHPLALERYFRAMHLEDTDSKINGPPCILWMMRSFGGVLSSWLQCAKGFCGHGGGFLREPLTCKYYPYFLRIFSALLSQILDHIFVYCAWYKQGWLVFHI